MKEMKEGLRYKVEYGENTAVHSARPIPHDAVLLEKNVILERIMYESDKA